MAQRKKRVRSRRLPSRSSRRYEWDVYLAHPIVGKKPETSAVVRRIKAKLRSGGLRVCDPEEWNIPDSRAQEVVERNLYHIARSQVFAAILPEPSLGVGGELVLAAVNGKPRYCFLPSEDYAPAWAMAYAQCYTRLDSFLLAVQSRAKD